MLEVESRPMCGGSDFYGRSLCCMLSSDNCVRSFFADRERTSSGNSFLYKNYIYTNTYIKLRVNLCSTTKTPEK